MAATKTKSRAKKKAPAKAKAKATAKTKPKAAAKKVAAPAPKKPAVVKAKKPAAAKAKKPAPPPVVDDVIEAPAVEAEDAGDDTGSNGDVSETAKTGAFARIKKGVGSFFSKMKITRKKAQPADDDTEADDDAPAATIEIATGDILVEADDRAKLRGAAKKPPPPPQPGDDDE